MDFHVHFSQTNIRGTYILDDKYTIPGPLTTKQELFANVAGGDAAAVTYRVSFITDTAMQGFNRTTKEDNLEFLVDTETGRMLLHTKVCS